MNAGRRESSVEKRVPSLEPFVRFLSSFYNLINDIILIYELVGVKLFFRRDFLVQTNFRSRTWLFRFASRLMQKFNFSSYKYFLTSLTQQKFLPDAFLKPAVGREVWDRILHDWLKVTKYHSRTFRFTIQPSCSFSAHKLRRYAELPKWGKIPDVIRIRRGENDDSFGGKIKGKLLKFPFIMLQWESSKINIAADYCTDKALEIGKAFGEKIDTNNFLRSRGVGAAGIYSNRMIFDT